MLLFVTVTQAGCIIISKPSYPKEWTLVDRNSEICASLPGNYANNGEAGKKGKNAPPLATLFFKDAKTATNVRILKKGDTSFLLISESSGAIVNSRTIEGKCGSPRFTVPPEEPEGFINREGVVGYQYDSTELEVSKDGMLVAHTTTGGFGIMLLIPAGGSESRWFHYPREEEEIKGAGSNEKP
jgi:hypothetical protein